jgi:CRISPR-associated protein Cmr2
MGKSGAIPVIAAGRTAYWLVVAGSHWHSPLWTLPCEPRHLETAPVDDKAFLAFSLGPVQPFIEAARTVRDLWSGSYLLAWLTFRAMKPVIDAHGPGAMVFPDVTRHALWRWETGQGPADLRLLEPCLPNRFLAEVPAASAEDLAARCEQECRGAWEDIAEAVRAALEETGHRHGTMAAGDSLWQRQVLSFFEVRTAVLLWREATPEKLRALLGESLSAGGAEDPLWVPRWEAAGKLLQAWRSIRHPPAYDPGYRAGEKVAQKCSLLGSYEHVGPADRAQAQEFWEAAAERWAHKGTRTGPRERLCAVSLVKRFAWPDYFVNLFHRDPSDLRFEDTATVAAALWLRADEQSGAPELRPAEVRRRSRKRDWSGQWLHWSRPDQDRDEEPAPTEPGFTADGLSVWDVIEQKRRRQGRPPIYYAILMIDGDNMGEHLRQARSAGRHRDISAALATFALDRAPAIVEKHAGELVYAGGDDVLAVLPTETALACATELNERFRSNWPLAGQDPIPATVSAGLAVVHSKEDLRFALRQARDAEKAAKGGGRDALRVVVCRRSGEHSGALCPWDFVPTVDAWVKKFQGASDRWAYHLKGELETLQGVPLAAMRAEIGRQVARSDERTRAAFPPAEMVQAFDSLRGARKRKPDGGDEARFATEADALEHFLTLCQTASFLARGRDA